MAAMSLFWIPPMLSFGGLGVFDVYVADLPLWGLLWAVCSAVPLYMWCQTSALSRPKWCVRRAAPCVRVIQLIWFDLCSHAWSAPASRRYAVFVVLGLVSAISWLLLLAAEAVVLMEVSDRKSLLCTVGLHKSNTRKQTLSLMFGVSTSFFGLIVRALWVGGWRPLRYGSSRS